MAPSRKRLVRVGMLVVMTVLTSVNAWAVIKCELLYTPDQPGAAPVASLIKPMAPIPGLPGKFSVLFAGDGVIRAAAATLQPSPRVPGAFMATLGVDVKNGTFGQDNTIQRTRLSGYRGQRVALAADRLPPKKSSTFFPAGQKPTFEPLKFTGSADFAPAAATALKDLVISKVELVCQDELK